MIYDGRVWEHFPSQNKNSNNNNNNKRYVFSVSKWIKTLARGATKFDGDMPSFYLCSWASVLFSLSLSLSLSLIVRFFMPKARGSLAQAGQRRRRTSTAHQHMQVKHLLCFYFFIFLFCRRFVLYQETNSGNGIYIFTITVFPFRPWDSLFFQ